jgi:hypothetical protein
VGWRARGAARSAGAAVADGAPGSDPRPGLREAAQRYPRPEHLGELEISITPGRGAAVDLAGAERFAALGVHRLILMPSPKLDGAGLERFVEDVGTRLVGRV